MFVESPIQKPLSEEEKLDQIQIPDKRDPSYWTKTPIIKTAWMEAVLENPKYSGIDMDRVIRGYVIQTITGDDETAFFEHNTGREKEIILARMEWEANLPSTYLPSEIQTEVKQTLEQVRDHDTETARDNWYAMNNKIKEMEKNYKSDIDYSWEKRREILDKDQWNWQKSKDTK